MEEVLGPERSGGQGLDCHQEESGNRVILALLQDPEARDQVDLVITHRDRRLRGVGRARNGALPTRVARRTAHLPTC